MLFSAGTVNSNKLVLVGMPLSGKTTIASLLSEKLNLPCFDCDLIIENEFKKSVSEFIDLYGMTKFRGVESEVIKKILEEDNACVFSLGGGGFMNKETRDKLLNKSLCINLDVNSNILKKRYKIYGHQAANSVFEYTDLYEKRKSIYNLAHVKISINDESPDEIYRSIIKKINCHSEI